jgi:myo-inositol-1(or 4)-monophosphatase
MQGTARVTLSKQAVDEYLQIAKVAAIEASTYLDGNKTVEVESIEGKDIKLVADKASEETILDVLAQTGIPVLTEESGLLGISEMRDAGLLWIIDPLDGSMNYYKGMRELCCVSIALWDSYTPVFGVVNRFACDEMFEGVVGNGVWLNGVAIKPSTVTEANQAVFATGLPLKGDHSPDVMEHLIKRMRTFKKVRMMGSAALMASFVACGRVDVYHEDGIMLWDIAAAAAIVEAAGGAVVLSEQDGYRCDVRCFASKGLRRACEAQGLWR